MYDLFLWRIVFFFLKLFVSEFTLPTPNDVEWSAQTLWQILFTTSWQTIRQSTSFKAILDRYFHIYMPPSLFPIEISALGEQMKSSSRNGNIFNNSNDKLSSPPRHVLRHVVQKHTNEDGMWDMNCNLLIIRRFIIDNKKSFAGRIEYERMLSYLILSLISIKKIPNENNGTRYMTIIHKSILNNKYKVKDDILNTNTYEKEGFKKTLIGDAVFSGNHLLQI